VLRRFQKAEKEGGHEEGRKKKEERRKKEKSLQLAQSPIK
jgi:hypothetical protein